jgi:ABC-2 type transport system ATP-binding protein
VLKQGKKLFAGTVSEVLSVSDTVELASGNFEILSIALKDFDGISTLRKEGELLIAHVNEGISTKDINEFLVEKGIVLSHLALRKQSLEQQFLELLQEAK